jgi:hypothetical protein
MQFISGHGIISADGGASSGTGGEGNKTIIILS